MRLPPLAKSVVRTAGGRGDSSPSGILPQVCIPMSPFCVNGQKEYRCDGRPVWVPCQSEITTGSVEHWSMPSLVLRHATNSNPSATVRP